MKGRVLTNEEIDEIVREPWTVHLQSYDDVARTLDVMRRSAKAWHRAYDVARSQDALTVAGETHRTTEGK